jgi:hypothetical protein
MTTAGGGWTEFFQHDIYSPGYFDSNPTVVNCSGGDCIRPLPRVFGPVQGMASCGDNAVTFDINGSPLTLFKIGLESGWVTLSNVAAATPGANASYATHLFTGNSTYKSWILSADDGNASHTFANASPRTGFNYCNGVSDNSSLVRLFYR